MNTSRHRTLNLLLYDYFDFCRQEQRIFSDAIRRYNGNGERLYNIMNQYMGILLSEIQNSSPSSTTTQTHNFSNENIPTSRRSVRLNPIIRRTSYIPTTATTPSISSIFSV